MNNNIYKSEIIGLRGNNSEGNGYPVYRNWYLTMELRWFKNENNLDLQQKIVSDDGLEDWINIEIYKK